MLLYVHILGWNVRNVQLRCSSGWNQRCMKSFRRRNVLTWCSWILKQTCVVWFLYITVTVFKLLTCLLHVLIITSCWLLLPPVIIICGHREKLKYFFTLEPVRMRIKSSSDAGELIRNQKVTLSCTTSFCTFHQLEVTWFKDGSALPQSGPALQLGPLTAKDSGNYTCGLKIYTKTISQPYAVRVKEAEEKEKDEGLLDQFYLWAVRNSTNCVCKHFKQTSADRQVLTGTDRYQQTMLKYVVTSSTDQFSFSAQVSVYSVHSAALYIPDVQMNIFYQTVQLSG